MKTFPVLALLALCGALANPALASEQPAPVKGCAAKQLSLRTQIDQAREQGHTQQQAGLETALGHVIATCTDAKLTKERESKVHAAQVEVNQRQADLDKALKNGDAGKIEKRQAKLAESRKELQDATDELDK